MTIPALRSRNSASAGAVLARFDSFVRDLAERVVRREWRLDLDVGDVIQEGHLAVIAAMREHVAARDGDVQEYVQAHVQEALNRFVRQARREITVRLARSGVRLDAQRFDDGGSTEHEAIAAADSEQDVFEQRTAAAVREVETSEREEEAGDLAKFVRWLPPMERLVVEQHFAGFGASDIAQHPAVIAAHGHPPTPRKVQLMLALARRKLLGFQTAEIQQEVATPVADDASVLAAKELIFSLISTRTAAGMELRDYQQFAVAAAFRDWMRGAKSTLYVCPTGGGKSIVFIKIVEAFVALMRQQGKPAHALVLSNQILLCDQLAAAFAEHTTLATGTEQDERAVDPDALPDVVCATVQTLDDRERLERFATDAFGLVVIDEADLSVSPSYQRVIQRFTEALRFGCTATPTRSDRVPLRLVFDSVCHRVELHDLIQGGHAPLVHRRLVRIDSVRFKGAPLTFGDFSDEWLERVLTEEKALHEVASPTLQLSDGRPTLVFAATVPHAVALAAMLNRYEPGCAAVVHGRMSKKQQREMIQRFAAGEFRLLVNCQIVGRGLDLPFVSCVAMARPTLSRTRYVQALGRGLRRAPGKDDLRVLDFTDNSLLHRIVTAVDALAGTRDPAVIRRAKVHADTADIRSAVAMALADLVAEDARASVLAEVYAQQIAVFNDVVDLLTPAQRRGREQNSATVGTINWDVQPLGQMTDERLSVQLGVSIGTVSRQRKLRDIPPFGAVRRGPLTKVGTPTPARKILGIDWDAQPLGKMPDGKLARVLGVGRWAVTSARKSRRIPRFRIDWDAQPLGVVPDAELAQKLDVSTHTVAKERKVRGIVLVRRIDWDAQPLGTMIDKELAARLGVCKSAVEAQRRKKGVAAFSRRRTDVNWSAQPLGQMPDTELARQLGVSEQSVFNARKKRHIPCFQPLATEKPNKQRRPPMQKYLVEDNGKTIRCACCGATESVGLHASSLSALASAFTEKHHHCATSNNGAADAR